MINTSCQFHGVRSPFCIYSFVHVMCPTHSFSPSHLFPYFTHRMYGRFPRKISSSTSVRTDTKQRRRRERKNSNSGNNNNPKQKRGGKTAVVIGDLGILCLCQPDHPSRPYPRYTNFSVQGPGNPLISGHRPLVSKDLYGTVTVL